MVRPFLILSMALMAQAGPLPAQEQVPQSRTEIQLTLAPIVRETAPAVVNIYAKRLVAQRVSPFAGDPFFDRFFQQQLRPRVQNSLGSGVIVDPSGIVVSNHHVVGDAQDIRVVLADGREYAARTLLADPEVDLAILAIEAPQAPLPALAFADSDQAEVGDLVLAIGNPFGVGQTVTSGIVSGLARSGIGGETGQGYLLQTDAAINPGNSGGALVDMRGALLGINTSILTRSGGSNGIGFAIPANLVRAYVDRARAGETTLRWPWAGLAGQPVDAALAEALGRTRPGGLLIAELHAESPFGAAGLAPGDVVLRLGGRPISSEAELAYVLRTLPQGKAPVTFARDGEVREAMVSVAPLPEAASAPFTVDTRGPFNGLVVEEITPQAIDAMGLPLSASGVVVRDPGRTLARLGLRRGDVLRAVGDRVVETPEDVARAAGRLGRVVELLIDRGGRRLSLRFRQ